MTRTFDTSTIQGLKAAEKFKAKMENLYDSVIVYHIGLYRVQIVGLNRNSTTMEFSSNTSRTFSRLPD